MILSQRQRAIITVAGIEAQLSIREIAEQVGCPHHSVRYDLERLIEARHIRKAWIIDSFKLGWTRYNIFFSTSLQNRKRKLTLLKQLAESQHTGYLTETSGDYDYEMALFGRNVGEILDLIHKLSSSHKGIFYSKAVSTRRFMSLFPRKYLSRKSSAVECLSFGSTEDVFQPDQLEHQILEQLASNAFLSMRQIARKLSKPAATIESRIRKLKNEGVIAGQVYSTNPSSFGCQNYVLMLFARGFELNFRDELFEFSKNHPNCTYFVECFGTWDYELGVEVESHEQLISLREELGERFGEYLNTIRTLSRYRVYKYSSYPIRHGI